MYDELNVLYDQLDSKQKNIPKSEQWQVLESKHCDWETISFPLVILF